MCEDPLPCAGKDELFWPKDKRCYRKHTKGPCTEGQLLVSSAQNDLIGDCRCENSPELSTYFWAATGEKYVWIPTLKHFARKFVIAT